MPFAPPPPVQQVGKGRLDYRRARELVKGWRHFHLGWAGVNDPPVRAGAGVVVAAQTLLLWTLNPLRISYVEEGAARLRLAGGTQGKGGLLAALLSFLPEHVASLQGAAAWARCRPAGWQVLAAPLLGGADIWLGVHGRRRVSASPPRPSTPPINSHSFPALPRRPLLAGHRLAFAHTTLRGHQISGEERFAVEWHPRDDSVW